MPGIDARDEKRLENFAALNGSAKPDYIVEENILGGKLASKILGTFSKAFGKWWGSPASLESDTLFRGAVTASKGDAPIRGKVDDFIATKADDSAPQVLANADELSKTAPNAVIRSKGDTPIASKLDGFVATKADDSVPLGVVNPEELSKAAPNTAASELLKAKTSNLNVGNHYCTECALDLHLAAGGEGAIVIFSGKNARWGKKYDWMTMGSNLNVEANTGLLDFSYHTVYTDGRYFYDPLILASPISQAQYTKMLKSVNPDGISWRLYSPDVPNPNVPQLKKGGF